MKLGEGRALAGFLEILRCPVCRGTLVGGDKDLSCGHCAAVYPVEDGVPFLTGELDSVKEAQASWFDHEVDDEYEIERPHGTPRFHAWLLEEKFRRSVSTLRPYLPGAVVATVCAGSGMDAEFLARSGAHVLAFDISSRAAFRSAERARRRRLQIFPVVADAERLPLADGAVDVAYVHDGLHHLERPDVALHELARVAGTAVSVNEPARAALTRVSIAVGYSGDVEEAGNRVRRMTVDEVAGTLRSGGFDVVSAQRYGMVYRHVAGRPVRLLSHRLLFAPAQAAFRSANLLVGRIGNKLSVQAVRSERVARRVVVHDFGGFPFPVQLSRELARRGDHVLHLHCPSYPNGRGRLERDDDDPMHFSSERVDLGRPFRKYSLVGRAIDEIGYGRRLRWRLREFAPDVVVSDAPLLVQGAALREARRNHASFVFWQQDVHGLAMREIARSRLPFVGRLVGAWFPRFERRLLLRSDRVVPVGDSFLSVLDDWGIPRQRISVIENWAPIEELPLVERENRWRHRQGIGDEVLFLYAGTLGLKHDCDLLYRLAATLGKRGARLAIVSEGLGADALSERLSHEPNPALQLLPFQPFDALPEMLGAADVLVALLGREFGGYSIPSKVLTYHCAGRPLLAAIPAENQASRFILRARSGIVVDPEACDEFLHAAVRLLEDCALREQLGQRARSHAEAVFGIETVADRFERVLARLEERASAPARDLERADA